MQKLDLFDHIINYVNEIKPYHTKLVDTVITYNINEHVKVKVTEQHNITADFFFDQRNIDRYGFERNGFDTNGLGMDPNDILTDPALNRYGYDVRKYDKNAFDVLPYYTIPNQDLMLRGLDDFALDFSPYDERLLFDGLDELELDFTPYDDETPRYYGLDEDNLDYTSFDDVYYDDFIYNEGLYDIGYKAKTYDFYYDHTYLQDHSEQASPTTIKATIKEKLVIDKSRVRPVGLDFVKFDSTKLDIQPNEIAINKKLPFDPYKPFDGGLFDTVTTFKNTDPGSRTFDIFNVCDPLLSKYPNEFLTMSLIDIKKITNSQLKLLTGDQYTNLILNPLLTNNDIVDLLAITPIEIIDRLTSNQLTLINEQIIFEISKILTSNSIVMLLSKLSADQLNNLDFSIFNNLTEDQLSNLSNNIFDIITQKYIVIDKNIDLINKIPENKVEFMQSSILVDLKPADIGLLPSSRLSILNSIAKNTYYSWPPEQLDGLSSDIVNLLTN